MKPAAADLADRVKGMCLNYPQVNRLPEDEKAHIVKQLEKFTSEALAQGLDLNEPISLNLYTFLAQVKLKPMIDSFLWRRRIVEHPIKLRGRTNGIGSNKFIGN